ASPAGGSSLVGTAWTLVSYSAGGQNSVNALAQAPATLAFNPSDRLSGSTGCNSFGGSYNVNGTDLTLTVGAMTQKACDPPVTAREAAVSRLCPVVASFTMTTTTVTLKGPQGNEIMRYSAAATGLADTSWQVTGVNNGNNAVVSTTATEKLTAQFTGADTFSG